MRRGHKVSHHQSALLIKASTLITTPRMVNDAQDFTYSGYLYINRNYPFGNLIDHGYTNTRSKQLIL